MASKKVVKPGQKTPVSGQYLEVGPLGGHTRNEVTAVKGKPMRPTSKSGNGYILVDKTK